MILTLANNPAALKVEYLYDLTIVTLKLFCPFSTSYVILFFAVQFF